MLDIEQEIERLVLLSLAEDRAPFDITSHACIPTDKIASADVILKEDSIVAGLNFLSLICKCIDPQLSCHSLKLEGRAYSSGTIIASIQGKAHSILVGERTLLNLLQHACGIAHLTAQCVSAVKGFPCDILDTRKTLPGLRALQKYAVATGGGKNHRFHLQEHFLIKNNHLKILKETTPRPVSEAVRRARALHPGIKIEIEVENLAMLEEALEEKADLIMLDNMSPSLIAKAVQIAHAKAYLEASGGITLGNVREYAATGVDGISIGALTHSAKAADISLRMSNAA
jgi:nicotinate-nucleotide pyrophosphorylase (carboxylating)